MMRRHGIPTAGFEVFTEAGAARDHAAALGAPMVVKASGLAAGKGAVVCETLPEAFAAIDEILTDRSFGAAGEQLVIEEFMVGEELSVFALCDGETVLTLLPAQDHKRIGEGDVGPNTGGMGAYAPVSIATPELLARIEEEILAPTVRAMAEEKRPYRGVLYAGIMVTDSGPKVVEFNCRFGDPEAQVILPLLESSLLELLLAVAEGRLASVPPPVWRAGAGVTTVLASGGYPGDYATGAEIHIPAELASLPDLAVFHAGTRSEDGRLTTSGGRVLAVTAIGDTVGAAAAASRAAAKRIDFDGRTFRRDIAWREIARS
jgi:phosphoribosylamine---glycine ligase